MWPAQHNFNWDNDSEDKVMHTGAFRAEGVFFGGISPGKTPGTSSDKGFRSFICFHFHRMPATQPPSTNSWAHWTRTAMGSWLFRNSGSSLVLWRANREASVNRISIHELIHIVSFNVVFSSLLLIWAAFPWCVVVARTTIMRWSRDDQETNILNTLSFSYHAHNTTTHFGSTAL